MRFSVVRICTVSDFPTQLEASQLVSKFYGLCTKASIREDGSINLYDEDAIAYAR